MAELILTDRQREIMALVIDGVEDKEIAETLGVRATTVRQLVSRALQKNDCPNRLRLAILMEREEGDA